MTRRARVLCAAAAAWLTALVLQRDTPQPPTVPPRAAAQPESPRIRIAHVEPPPLPAKPPVEPTQKAKPPVPQRPPAPAPAAAAPRRPSVQIRPDAGALRRGAELLERGRFPRLRATYARVGFPKYRDALQSLGAGFFLYDADARRPLARVHPRSGAVQGELRLDGLSVWPRDVTRHLPQALSLGREAYPQVDRVVLLPPRAVDAALLGGLTDYLRQQGVRPDRLVRVDLAYELRGTRLLCEVLAVGLSDGSTRELGLQIELSGGTSS